MNADNVTLFEECLQAHTVSTTTQLRIDREWIIEINGHAESHGSLGDRSSDSAKSENSHRLSLRVMPQRRSRLASPGTGVARMHADGQVAKGPDCKPDC